MTHDVDHDTTTVRFLVEDDPGMQLQVTIMLDQLTRSAQRCAPSLGTLYKLIAALEAGSKTFLTAHPDMWPILIERLREIPSNVADDLRRERETKLNREDEPDRWGTAHE